MTGERRELLDEGDAEALRAYEHVNIPCSGKSFGRRSRTVRFAEGKKVRAGKYEGGKVCFAESFGRRSHRIISYLLTSRSDFVSSVPSLNLKRPKDRAKGPLKLNTAAKRRPLKLKDCSLNSSSF